MYVIDRRRYSSVRTLGTRASREATVALTHATDARSMLRTIVLAANCRRRWHGSGAGIERDSMEAANGDRLRRERARAGVELHTARGLVELVDKVVGQRNADAARRKRHSPALSLRILGRDLLEIDLGSQNGRTSESHSCRLLEGVRESITIVVIATNESSSCLDVPDRSHRSWFQRTLVAPPL